MSRASVLSAAAANGDIKWFQEFFKAAKSDSIIKEARILTIHEQPKEYPTLHNKSVEVVDCLNFEFENVSMCATVQRKTSSETCFWLEVTFDPIDQVDSLAKD